MDHRSKSLLTPALEPPGLLMLSIYLKSPYINFNWHSPCRMFWECRECYQIIHLVNRRLWRWVTFRENHKVDWTKSLSATFQIVRSHLLAAHSSRTYRRDDSSCTVSNEAPQTEAKMWCQTKRKNVVATFSPTSFFPLCPFFMKWPFLLKGHFNEFP